MTITTEKITELRAALKDRYLYMDHSASGQTILRAAPDLLDEIERLQTRLACQKEGNKSLFQQFTEAQDARDRCRDIAVRLADEAADVCISLSMGWDDSGSYEKLFLTLKDPEIAALLKEEK